jgi:hypothetical protein
MAIRQLPIVGRPMDPPAPLRKIAIEEHFIDPTLFGLPRCLTSRLPGAAGQVAAAITA